MTLSGNPKRLQQALDEIDRFNKQDPNKETFDGIQQPREWVYSERLARWVEKLHPNPSDSLRIAARGQHIGRWTIARDCYPMTRGGYLLWRQALKSFHAQKVAEILHHAGYEDDFIGRVRSIIQKENIKGDPNTQTIEDALCLVFLETQYEDLRAKTPEPKMMEVIRKTWRKMSPKGHEEALKLDYSPAGKDLLKKSLAGEI